MSKFDIQEKLNKKYEGIKSEYYSEKDKIDFSLIQINKQIEELNTQKDLLKIQDFKNGIDFMVLKNNAAEESIQSGLHEFSGNIVDIYPYKKDGKSFSSIFYLDLKATKDGLVFKRTESKENEMNKTAMFNSLSQIANVPEIYNLFNDFSKISDSELEKRTIETKIFSESLLKCFLSKEIKEEGCQRIAGSNLSLNKTKYILNGAKEKLAEEIDSITSNLPRIIRESCDLPISDFKNKNDLYIKEHKDKYVMIIDNHNKIISNGLLKRINIDPKSHPDLIYLEVDQKNFDSLNNILKSSYIRKNQRFDLEASIESAIEKNYKQLGLASLGGFGAGTLGTIISQWAYSWASQNPVQHGEHAFIVGGILAGASILGYSLKKGIDTTMDKIDEVKNINNKNNALVEIVKNTKYTSDPVEITRRLASTYR